eukprot:6212744-Pleurochrysis_carterae.AAC.6
MSSFDGMRTPATCILAQDAETMHVTSFEAASSETWRAVWQVTGRTAPLPSSSPLRTGTHDGALVLRLMLPHVLQSAAAASCASGL